MYNDLNTHDNDAFTQLQRTIFYIFNIVYKNTLIAMLLYYILLLLLQPRMIGLTHVLFIFSLYYKVSTTPLKDPIISADELV